MLKVYIRNYRKREREREIQTSSSKRKKKELRLSNIRYINSKENIVPVKTNEIKKRRRTIFTNYIRKNQQNATN